MTTRTDIKPTTADIESLFRSHFDALHALATHLLHDEEVARDTVHDAFASLLNSASTCDSLPERESMPAYLLRTVRNLCLNHIRHAGAHERFLRLYSADAEEIESGEWPDEATMRRLDEIVRTELPPQCRRAVLLRFRRAMTYRQIAAEMQISEVAVYKHLRHALDVLRQHFPHNDQD